MVEAHSSCMRQATIRSNSLHRLRCRPSPAMGRSRKSRSPTHEATERGTPPLPSLPRTNASDRRRPETMPPPPPSDRAATNTLPRRARPRSHHARGETNAAPRTGGSRTASESTRTLLPPRPDQTQRPTTRRPQSTTRSRQWTPPRNRRCESGSSAAAGSRHVRRTWPAVLQSNPRPLPRIPMRCLASLRRAPRRPAGVHR